MSPQLRKAIQEYLEYRHVYPQKRFTAMRGQIKRLAKREGIHQPFHEILGQYKRSTQQERTRQ